MRRMMVLTGLVASAAIAASAVGFAGAASPAGSKANPIKATTSPTKGFLPKKITVKPGTRVFFKNIDKAPHNAVEDRTPPRLRSGNPTSGNFSVKAPTRVGTYSYICTVHSFMRGTMVVKR